MTKHARQSGLRDLVERKSGYRASALVGVCLAAALWPAVARGQAPAGAAAGAASAQAGSTPAAVQQADALFKEGVALAEAGDYGPACAKLEESYRLDPAPGTLFNIASCEGKRGRFATAAQRWRELHAMLPADHSKREEAKERAAQADARAGRLVLRLAPEAPKETRVALDGEAIEPARLGTAIAVDPGAHRVIVTAPGYESRDIPAEAGSGETREVIVTPGAALPGPRPSALPAATAAPALPAPEVGTAAKPGFLSRHKTSLSVLGAGLVPAGVGLGLSVEIVSGHYSRFVQSCSGVGGCPADGKAALDAQVTAVNVLFGIAGAAGAAAGVLFVLEELGQFSSPGSQVSVAVGPTGASLTLRR